MRENILRASNVTKIYLIYTDNNGLRKKESVTLRFMDLKECYFASLLPVSFTKPKPRTLVEINVYTVDGVYKTKTTINDTSVSLNEVMYELVTPKQWDFVQLRQSMRKLSSMPFIIKYNDGYTIEGKTHDIALNGFSFYAKNTIPSIYKKTSAILTLQMPSGLILNLPDGKLITEVKFVREKPNANEDNEMLYAYRIIRLSYDAELVLKNYLLTLL